MKEPFTQLAIQLWRWREKGVLPKSYNECTDIYIQAMSLLDEQIGLAESHAIKKAKTK
ncbi:MAG: hypothetical protein HRU43_03750 [Simkaniaceae bacterium]|nr:hypothetical protein [Simkaniaceae bacterium]